MKKRIEILKCKEVIFWKSWCYWFSSDALCLSLPTNGEAAPRPDWLALDKAETLFVDLTSIQQRADSSEGPSIYRFSIKQMNTIQGKTPEQDKAYEYSVILYEMDLGQGLYRTRHIRYSKDQEHGRSKVVESHRLSSEEFGWKPTVENQITGFIAAKMKEVVEEQHLEIDNRSSYRR